jgi:hypothetical protein
MNVPAIPYLSPVLRYDTGAKVVVVQHRDVQTGKVSRQFPSQEAVRELREIASGRAPAQTPAKPEAAAPKPTDAAAAVAEPGAAEPGGFSITV